jgi:very-short-patch-repair endonuclease
MSRIHYKNYRGITLLARELRHNMTPAESRLWKILRKKKFSGYRFLRQHPIFYRIDKEWVEFFIADFYCSKLKLIVEMDGEIHLIRKDYDTDRDAKLKSKGMQVVRLRNEETENVDILVNKIYNIINLRRIQIKDEK